MAFKALGGLGDWINRLLTVAKGPDDPIISDAQQNVVFESQGPEKANRASLCNDIW